MLWFLIAISCTDLVPGDFIHVIGDAHVYRTHIRPLQEQLQKLPKPFPVRIIMLNWDYARLDFQLIWKYITGWERLKFPLLIQFSYNLYHSSSYFTFISIADFEDKSWEEEYRFFCGSWFQTCRLWSSPEDRNENGGLDIS